MSEVEVKALEREREGYVARGLTARVALVDKAIAAAKGGKAKGGKETATAPAPEKA